MSEQTLNPSELEKQIIGRAMKDPAFRDRLIANPRQALASMGVLLPEGTQVKVVEAEPNTLYLVLPSRPEPIGSVDELSEAELANVAGGISINDYVCTGDCERVL